MAPVVSVPRAVVPRTPSQSLPSSVLVLTPLLPADGRGPPPHRTAARLPHDGESLHVRFVGEDRDIWGTYTHRDAPLHEEEVVELFLAPGEADPVEYFEFEVNPLGALFDARVRNPASRRAEMTVDTGWDCRGIEWRAGPDPSPGRWWAELVIPWSSVCPGPTPPAVWRANLYRIERPRDSEPEFSCWSPTFTQPADFHKPAFFGYLELGR